jgi:exodeoxyribonuclease VIII
MKPELVHGMDFDDYNAVPAERKSTLTEMATSPGAYRQRCDTPFKTTPDMDFGDAVDTLLFEGKDALLERFAMRPEGLKLTTKEGRAWKNDHAWKDDGMCKTIVPAHEVYSTALAVLMDPVAAPILDAGEFQVSAFAEVEGLPCKVRPDITSPGILDDLKVTGTFDLHSWTRIAYRLKYHWQAAMYCDVMTAASGEVYDRFRFVVAESKPPHHVAVREMPASVIEQGRDEYQMALAKVKYYRELNHWPTSTGEVETLEFERWMR